MPRFNVQIGYYQHYSATVEVEADDLEGACNIAVQTDVADWKSTDDVTQTYVDAIAPTPMNPWDKSAPDVPGGYAIGSVSLS